MLFEIFNPSSHVLETFQRKYENNFPLFTLMNIFLQSLYNLEKFFAKLPKLLTRIPKTFLDMFLLIYVVEEKYELCSWENMQKLYHGSINSWSDTPTM